MRALFFFFRLLFSFGMCFEFGLFWELAIWFILGGFKFTRRESLYMCLGLFRSILFLRLLIFSCILQFRNQFLQILCYVDPFSVLFHL